MKRCLLLLICVALLCLGCGGEKGTFINIATGGTAGTYYPIGGAIADILNKSGMNAAAQSTGASVANINMLRDKQVELAIVQNDITYYAVNGQEMFEEKVEGLNAIASLYPETCQFVTRQDSGITDISQLKGKRVAVGAAGSGAEANARQILAAYGLTYDDVDEQFLSFAESAYALKDQTVDAAFVTAGFPTAAVQDVASQNPINVLTIDDAHLATLSQKYPFYSKIVIPANTYTGQTTDVQSVSVMAILIANDKVDAKVGEQIANALFDNLDKLQAAHSAAKNISKENARLGIDFLKHNEGAAKVIK